MQVVQDLWVFWGQAGLSMKLRACKVLMAEAVVITAVRLEGSHAMRLTCRANHCRRERVEVIRVLWLSSMAKFRSESTVSSADASPKFSVSCYGKPPPPPRLAPQNRTLNFFK